MGKGRGQQGTLEQLPDGRWRARYRENGRDGKRPQRTFTKRKDAADWLRDRLGETAQAQDGDTSVLVRRREQGRTVTEAIDDYLAAHECSPGRMRVLTEQLKLFRRRFGSRLLQSIEPYELQAWKKELSPGYANDVFRAAKQMFRQARAWHWIATNLPFRWDTITLISDEIDQAFELLPVFAAGTGMRPEEWAALEHRDIDVGNRVAKVRRVWNEAGLVELGADGAKTWRQRRDVPLRQVVVDAYIAAPRRIDTPLVFPSKRKNNQGGWHLNLTGFRHNFWIPALKAAGVEYQRIYDMRHTYASESIAAGIDLFTLSRRMGTSLEQIDRTYGHLVHDANERELALLDAWDSGRRVDAAAEGST